MTHFWLRAEQRANEERTPLMPEGAAKLLAAGHSVIVERSPHRIVPDSDYGAAGCTIAPQDSWPEAPVDAVILGLKELDPHGPDLRHRHIMFGHAYKGQPDGPQLLARFKRGGGTLLDLEYLTDDHGRRLAAFGYWAGYVGAAVSLIAWTAQQTGKPMSSLSTWDGANPLLADLQTRMIDLGGTRPTAIVIGAKGRVGTGARDLCTALGVAVTAWDMEETATGGPFPEILAHDIFLNCVLAGPNTPVFVSQSALTAQRRLSVIGDIACDPGSDYNPVPLYDRATNWKNPTIRVHDAPPLDIMAVDNLPSLLPRDSSEDFAEQLLPLLLDFETHPAWPHAATLYEEHATKAG
ncbi:saccharopine dehydrogenase [Aestuariibius sp. 2305UL40-4]|uniref:saccharopine dehydrogenase n=1 Tax=Aestuariibius violaceus TaxID=3234132 RepID=UPI00345E251D